MTGEPTIQFTFAVDNPELDDERRQKIANKLLREIRDLDEAHNDRTFPEGHLPWFYHCVVVGTYYDAFRLLLSRVESCKL